MSVILFEYAFVNNATGSGIEVGRFNGRRLLEQSLTLDIAGGDEFCPFTLVFRFEISADRTRF